MAIVGRRGGRLDGHPGGAGGSIPVLSSMNYLAHLYLSDGTPDGLLGNLMADFIRDDGAGYGPAVQAGVRLHRRIDAFTDCHPIVVECRREVAPPFRRFAGIITDIAWDHFLARSWHRYASEPLDGFVNRVYRLLTEQAPVLPERLARTAPHMIAGDWLRANRSLEGTCAAFPRAARRLTRETCLGEAGLVLKQHHAAWEQSFHRFFPDVIRCARPR